MLSSKTFYRACPIWGSIEGCPTGSSESPQFRPPNSRPTCDGHINPVGKSPHGNSFTCVIGGRQERETGNELGGQVSDLIEFAKSGNRMGTILIDPPWPTVNAVLPYLSITPDELQRLPIPDLAADRCHLHMWATANNFLFDAKDVIEAWGFRVVGNFVWAKTQLGRGNYWRQSHEILLTAVRSEDDRFDDMSLRSWIAAPRGRHSEKPDAIREMIERASPVLASKSSQDNRYRIGTPGVMRSLNR
jgi:N6-adenosine-specific RNA methylase IME4